MKKSRAAHEFFDFLDSGTDFAAAAIALSLQGCNLVTTCPPENLPRYVATLTIVNESSHTVAVSDWVWAETGSMLSRNNAAPA